MNITNKDSQLLNLYLNNPCEYSLFPLNLISKYNYKINNDFLVCFDADVIYTYNFNKTFEKFDFNKGYKKIYINERIYNKIVKRINFKLRYKAKRFIKACKYSDGELIIEEPTYKKPNGSFKLFTTYFEEELFQRENIELSIFDDYVIWYELSLIEIESIKSYEELKNKIEEVSITNNKPSLLLHSCCGPCSSECLRMLSNAFNITILYYNPNIYPKEEYYHRLEEQYKIIKALNLDIKVIEKDYNHIEYLNYINGYENLGEKSKRCYLCYEQRLIETAKAAHEKYDYFTTTISISPYKISKWLNEIGLKLEKQYNVKYLYSDFKQENGYLKSIELSKKYNLYRQDYCGCEFSLYNK